MLLDPVRLSRLAGGTARSAVRHGKGPGRAAWRRWVLARGVDDTVGATGRRCLVVAPHPDDETIGCGATIARKRAAGTDVSVMVLTDGRHSHRSERVRPLQLAARREAESRRACELLGVDPTHVHFGGFEEGTLARCLDAVAEAVGAIVDRAQPDEVLVCSQHDWNDDHRLVHAATCQALAARDFTGQVGAYPVWFWADGPWRNAPWEGLGPQVRGLAADPAQALRLPAPWLVSTAGFVDLKRAAYGCYRSQVTNLTGEATWQVFPERWIEPFLGATELFFPVELEVGAPAATSTGTAAPAPAAPARRRARTAPTAGDGALLTSVRDEFADDRLAGDVRGSRSSSGATRHGVDVEATIGIDNDELRLATLATPGFGRQSLTYGPFERRPGLTLAVQVLNSHNTAQTNILGEGRKDMLRRLTRDLSTRGSSASPRLQLGLPFVDDNLAVGFWPDAAPADPRERGNAFVMHAASTVNGELRARTGQGLARIYQGVQNVPITYLVCLRDRGAAYFVGSVPGAAGMAALPALRPVAIDHAADDPILFGGVTQAVHGEVGHDISSRVSLVAAEVVAELADCALLADPLRGEHLTAGGPDWQVVSGALDRHAGGTSAVTPRRSGSSATIPGETDPGGGDPADAGLADAGIAEATAVAEASQPAGLVHLVVDTAAVFAPHGRAGILWRAGPQGAFRVVVTADRAELSVGAGPLGSDGWSVVAEGPARLEAAARCSLQVIDDGHQFSVHLDGALLFDRWFDDERLADQSGAGFVVGAREHVAVRDFEVLPRLVAAPPQLHLEPSWCERGGRIALAEPFTGPAGELAEPWARSLGEGRFARTGDGSARVVADRDRPNPGRTIYSVPWDDPGFADIEVELTPPGLGRGEGHQGRGGLAFFQDADTHLVVNMWLDDAPIHDGSSISMFLRSQGYERLYDACWANVGRKVHWGRPFRLRLAFDGAQLMTWLDDEPVLYRRVRDVYPAAPPIRINRVGLVANWEWGDDTGTIFRDFTARSR